MQLTIFSCMPATTASSSSPSIVGITIRLDRPIDHERPCCDNLVIITAGTLHRGRIRCAACGHDRGWLSGTTIDFIEQVSRRFGAPSLIILKRNSSHVAGAGGEEQIHCATESNVK
jgi:hypothetical protein